MKDLSWKDGALFALAYGIGYGLHEFAARTKEKAKIQGGPEGFEIGAVTGAISAAAGLILDSQEFADIGVGLGSGIATNDLVWHFKHKEKFRKMMFMGERSLVDRWTKVIEIDPSLSDDDKEAIVIPLIRDLGAQCAPVTPMLCHPQFALPSDIRLLQVQACEAITKLLRISPLNPVDMVKVQRWLQLEGVGKGGYEPDESMTSPNPELRRPDVDRFRLPSLLLAKWMETGIIPFDCVEENERVLVTDGSTYAAIPIKDLEPTGRFNRWMAVSYNWFEKRFVFRSIRRSIPKGPLDAYRVYMKNGTSFICTSDHQVFQRWIKSKKPIIKERGIITAYHSLQPCGTTGRALPSLATVLELPSLGAPSPLSDAELWVLGSYLAEGWVRKGAGMGGTLHKNHHPDTNISIWISSGYDPDIPKMLDAANLDFKEHPNNHGVPQYYLNSNDKNRRFRQSVLSCGGKSSTKRIPPWIFGLERRRIEALLSGYAAGDGHKYHGEAWNRKLTYSTCNENLARDVRLAHLAIGEPLYTDFIADSKSANHTPMWRLNDNPNSFFRRPLEGYRGLSDTAISRIEYVGKKNMCDITVDADHNFILADSGVIVSNCDDGKICVDGVSWFNGIAPYGVVISQFKDRHLHHIAPAIDIGGQIVVLETIKYGLPPFRLEDARKVFAPLTRMVLMHPNGRYEDINVR